MSMKESAREENLLSAASAAAAAAKRSEELLRQLVEKDRAAILSEWTDRDMSVGNVIYKAGSVTIADILDHAAREARRDQGEEEEREHRRSPRPRFDHLKWAEGLIVQLPVTHDGRNSWLLNHGRCAEADALRKRRWAEEEAERERYGSEGGEE